MSLFYSGRNKGREPPLLYIYISFLEEEERKYFPTSERILERSSKCGGERVEGEGGEGQVSARNRSLTAVLHELSPSLCLYLCLPFLPFSSSADGYRHATPCNTARCSSELRSSGRSWTFQWQQKRQRRPRDPLIQLGRERERNFFAELSKRAL